MIQSPAFRLAENWGKLEEENCFLFPMILRHLKFLSFWPKPSMDLTERVQAHGTRTPQASHSINTNTNPSINVFVWACKGREEIREPILWNVFLPIRPGNTSIRSTLFITVIAGQASYTARIRWQYCRHMGVDIHVTITSIGIVKFVHHRRLVNCFDGAFSWWLFAARIWMEEWRYLWGYSRKKNCQNRNT